MQQTKGVTLMTNTAKIADVTKSFVGKTLTAKMVVALVLAKYPDTNAGSILASDYAGPNPKSGVIYADQLFDRVTGGYVVRATAILKPKTGRSKQSLTDALVQANALLTPSVPTDIIADSIESDELVNAQA